MVVALLIPKKEEEFSLAEKPSRAKALLLPPAITFFFFSSLELLFSRNWDFKEETGEVFDLGRRIDEEADKEAEEVKEGVGDLCFKWSPMEVFTRRKRFRSGLFPGLIEPEVRPGVETEVAMGFPEEVVGGEVVLTLLEGVVTM